MKDVATVGEGGEKTLRPNTDAVFAMLVAATDRTSARPKLTLIMKKDIMKKKGLPVEKAIDTTAPTKKWSFAIPNLHQIKGSQARLFLPGFIIQLKGIR